MVGPLLIAHRGDSANAPENTLAAFRSALEVEPPPEYLELDVHLSLDGEIVVMHDPTLDRTTDGHGLIAELPWKEISTYRASYSQRYSQRFVNEPLPRLRDVLDLVRDTDVGLMIELKSPQVTRPVLNLLRERGEGSQHVVASFDLDSLAVAASSSPAVRRLWLVDALRDDSIGLCSRLDVSIVGAGYCPLRDHVERVQQTGKQVWIWTVDDEAEATRLASWQVDGLITNRPRAMRSVFPKG